MKKNTLDIIIKDIRTTISGMKNIKKYCKTDDIKDIPLKKLYQKNEIPEIPRFPC